MNYREYFLSLYRDYLIHRNDGILKDNNYLKLNKVFLSFSKNKDGLYSVKLHNINNLTSRVEEVLSNVTYSHALNFASFLIRYFKLNDSTITYYGSSINNLEIPSSESYADRMTMYLKVTSIVQLDFTYDDLDMLIEMHDLEGSGIVDENKKSFLCVIRNDDSRKNKKYTNDVQAIINKTSKLSDEFKRTYVKAMILNNPYDVYKSLNKEDQERLLDLYFDPEVLNLDNNIENCYSTLDLDFNNLLYDHIIKKMLSSEVGKLYSEPAKYNNESNAKNLANMQLVMYKDLLIDLNSKQYIYRFDSFDDGLIRILNLNGIEVKKYKELNL